MHVRTLAVLTKTSTFNLDPTAEKIVQTPLRFLRAILSVPARESMAAPKTSEALRST
jgi:hypothetical protein